MKLISYSSVLLVLFVLVLRPCNANPVPQEDTALNVEAGGNSGGTPGNDTPAPQPSPGEGTNANQGGGGASTPDPTPAGGPGNTAPAAAGGAAPAAEECDTDCKLSHQTTIIIFIFILVCIILLIVILFFCYFMKKLHGKALLTADHAQILHRPPKSKTTKTTTKNPDGYSETNRTETVTVDESDPNESKVITTTTTKIVSKSTDEVL